MLLTQVLVVVAIAGATVMAALPASGDTVVIVNQETGLFFDDRDRIAPIGNPIIAFPFNNGGNQKWVLASNNTSGSSGDYTFTGVLPVAKIFSNGTLGAGLNVQATLSVFTITDLGSDNVTTIYRITQGAFAVTAADNRNGQLTLQTLNSTSRFQHWRIFPTTAI